MPPQDPIQAMLGPAWERAQSVVADWRAAGMTEEQIRDALDRYVNPKYETRVVPSQRQGGLLGGLEVVETEQRRPIQVSVPSTTQENVGLLGGVGGVQGATIDPNTGQIMAPGQAAQVPQKPLGPQVRTWRPGQGSEAPPGQPQPVGAQAAPQGARPVSMRMAGPVPTGAGGGLAEPITGVRALSQPYQQPAEYQVDPTQYGRQFTTEQQQRTMRREQLQQEYNTLTAKQNPSMAETTRRQELALELEADTAQQEADAALAMKQQRELELADMRRAQQEARGQEQEQLQADINRLNDMIQEHRQTEIDPNRFLREKPAWQTALALALGAVGQAFQRWGGNQSAQNMGLVALNKAIDRDIRAQEAQIAKQGRVIGLEQNRLQQYRAILGDNEAARNALRLESLQKFDRLLDIESQKYGSERVQANVAKAKAQIAKQSQDEAMDLYQTMANMAAQREQLALARAQFGMAQQQAAMRTKREVPPSLIKFGAFRENSREERKEARIINDDGTGTLRILGEMSDVRRKYFESGAGQLAPKVVNDLKVRGEALRTQLIARMRRSIAGPGVSSDQDMEMVRDLSPDPTSWANEQPLIDLLVEQTQTQLKNQMYNRGYAPEPGFGITAPGGATKRL